MYLSRSPPLTYSCTMTTQLASCRAGRGAGSHGYCQCVRKQEGPPTRKAQERKRDFTGFRVFKTENRKHPPGRRRRTAPHWGAAAGSAPRSPGTAAWGAWVAWGAVAGVSTRQHDTATPVSHVSTALTDLAVHPKAINGTLQLSCRDGRQRFQGRA